MIYLISPYSEGNNLNLMQERYEAACDACAILANKKISVYSCIVHWHPIACRHNLPRGHEFWEFHDHEMIALSTAVIILKLDGWEKSNGVFRDTQIALKFNKLLHHSTLDELRYIDL